MPHLVILYSGNLDRPELFPGANIQSLCNKLAQQMCKQRDETDKPVFPIGGVRVLAYPAAHFAIADGSADCSAADCSAADLTNVAQPNRGKQAGGSGHYAFAYLNCRMAKGRSAATHLLVGKALEAVAIEHFAQLLLHHHIGITVQIDEGLEVFDAKNSSLHPLFK
jgi:5-carboxymethyl-2-hydroxymuconate isomerase